MITVRKEDVPALVEKHQAGLLAYVSALAAGSENSQQIVRDVFLDLLRSTVKTSSAEIWLFSRCHRKMTDFPHDAAEAIDAPPPSDLARQLIARLSEPQREAVLLKFQHGFSFSEIARITGLSLPNTAFLIHTGMKRLHSALQPLPENPQIPDR